MSKRRYRIYSDEFKRNVLELAETSDKSDAQIERDMGMSADLLSRWQKRYKESEESNGLELNEVEQLKAECADQRFRVRGRGGNFRLHDGLVQSPASSFHLGLSLP